MFRGSSFGIDHPEIPRRKYIAGNKQKFAEVLCAGGAAKTARRNRVVAIAGPTRWMSKTVEEEVRARRV